MIPKVNQHKKSKNRIHCPEPGYKRASTHTLASLPLPLGLIPSRLVSLHPTSARLNPQKNKKRKHFRTPKSNNLPRSDALRHSSTFIHIVRFVFCFSRFVLLLAENSSSTNLCAPFVHFSSKFGRCCSDETRENDSTKLGGRTDFARQF
jgi:hypothetical protein